MSHNFSTCQPWRIKVKQKCNWYCILISSNNSAETLLSNGRLFMYFTVLITVSITSLSSHNSWSWSGQVISRWSSPAQPFLVVGPAGPMTIIFLSWSCWSVSWVNYSRLSRTQPVFVLGPMTPKTIFFGLKTCPCSGLVQCIPVQQSAADIWQYSYFLFQAHQDSWPYFSVLWLWKSTSLSLVVVLIPDILLLASPAQ
jgi:hypothetical protein